MLAQSTDAQALEKTVIAGYNSKLAARAQSFAAANAGVSTIKRVSGSQTRFTIFCR